MVIPTPAEIKDSEGSEVLMTGLVIRYQKELEKEVGYLADMLEEVMGTRPGMVHGQGVGNKPGQPFPFRIGTPEGYELRVNQGAGIHIEGGDAAGVFYGIQSLLAMLPIEVWRDPQRKLQVSCVSIKDSPAFHYRGIMLDVARNLSSARVGSEVNRCNGIL